MNTQWLLFSSLKTEAHNCSRTFMCITYRKNDSACLRNGSSDHVGEQDFLHSELISTSARALELNMHKSLGYHPSEVTGITKLLFQKDIFKSSHCLPAMTGVFSLHGWIQNMISGTVCLLSSKLKLIYLKLYNSQINTLISHKKCGFSFFWLSWHWPELDLALPGLQQ